MRQPQSLTVKTLEAVNQHRAILLVEYIATNLDDVVRRDSDHVLVEGGVVEGAQCDAVPYRRHTVRIRVGHDVSRIEELIAPQAADRAVMLVRPHNAFPKLALVQPLLEQA